MKMLIALDDSLFILSFLCEGKVMLVGKVIFKVTGRLFAKSLPEGSFQFKFPIEQREIYFWLETK